MKGLNEFIKMCKPKNTAIPNTVFSTGDGILRFTNLDQYVSYKTNMSFPAFSMELKKFKDIMLSGSYSIAQMVDKYSSWMYPFDPILFPSKSHEFICHLYDIKYVKQMTKIAGNDPMREALSCLYFEDGKVIATDAHVLVICKHCIREHNGYNMLINKNHISLLNANFYDIYKTDSPNYVCFLNPEKNIEMFVRQSEYKYPDFNAVMPKDTPYQFNFLVPDIINRIEMVCAGIEKGIVEINFTKNVITAMDDDLTIKVDSYLKLEPHSEYEYTDDLIIGFSPDVLLKGLKMITHKLSVMHVTASDRLIKINNNIVIAPKMKMS